MTTRMPLFDGTEIDFDGGVDPHPYVGDPSASSEGQKKVFHTDFEQEELPDWLTYQTDNGDANPTFQNETEIQLNTGTTSTGDATALSFAKSDGTVLGKSWSNYRFIRFYAWGFSAADSNTRIFLHYGDDKDVADANESIFYNFDDTFKGVRIKSGGSGVTDGTLEDANFDETVEHTYGLEIAEPIDSSNSTDHYARWVIDGYEYGAVKESVGWLSDAAHNLHVGVATNDTAADRTASLDGIHLELMRL